MFEREMVVRALARALLSIEAGDSVRVLEAMAGAALRRMRAGDWRLRAGGGLPGAADAMPPGAAGYRSAPGTSGRQEPAAGGLAEAAVAFAGVPDGRAPDTADPDPRCVAMCDRIARRAVSGALADLTRGANAWHRVGEAPAWAHGATPVAEVGPYLFYRLADQRVVDAPPAAAHDDDGEAIMPSATWMGGRVV